LFGRTGVFDLVLLLLELLLLELADASELIFVGSDLGSDVGPEVASDVASELGPEVASELGPEVASEVGSGELAGPTEVFSSTSSKVADSFFPSAFIYYRAI
jgi:hypothetical protein